MMENAIEQHSKHRRPEPGDEVRPLVVDAVESVGVSVDRLMAPPPSPPESVECSSGDEDDAEELADAERAGYEYCAEEAIRYLVEVERLDPGHPMVRQLRRLFDAVAAAASGDAPQQ